MARPVVAPAVVSVHCGSHWSMVLVRTTSRLASRALRVTASRSCPVPPPELQVCVLPAASATPMGTGRGSGGCTNGSRSGFAETDSCATPSCSRAPTREPSTSRVRTRRGCAGSARSTCATRTCAVVGTAPYRCLGGLSGGSWTSRGRSTGDDPSRSTVLPSASSEVGRQPVASRPTTLAEPSEPVRSTTSPDETPDVATVRTRSPVRLVTSASSTPATCTLVPVADVRPGGALAAAGAPAAIPATGAGTASARTPHGHGADVVHAGPVQPVGRDPRECPRPQAVEQLGAAGRRGVVGELDPVRPRTAGVGVPVGRAGAQAPPPATAAAATTGTVMRRAREGCTGISSGMSSWGVRWDAAAEGRVPFCPRPVLRRDPFPVVRAPGRPGCGMLVPDARGRRRAARPRVGRAGRGRPRARRARRHLRRRRGAGRDGTAASGGGDGALGRGGGVVAGAEVGRLPAARSRARGAAAGTDAEGTPLRPGGRRVDLGRARWPFDGSGAPAGGAGGSRGGSVGGA